MYPEVGLGIDMHGQDRSYIAPLTSSPSRIARSTGVKRSLDPENTSYSAKPDHGARRRKTVAGESTSTAKGPAHLAHPYKRQQTLQAQMQTQTQAPVTMQSSKAMKGLLLAEVGASMVEMDKLESITGPGSRFKEGKYIEPGAFTPMEDSDVDFPSKRQRRKSVNRFKIEYANAASLDRGLARHGTLLSTSPTSPIRRSEELKALLGGSSSKVKSGAVIAAQPSKMKPKSTSKDSQDAVMLEQGRSRVRVALDMDLESNVAVEGGYISGTLLIRVRPKRKDDLLQLGRGKVRIAGFEVTPKNEERSIFYQVSAPLMDISNGCDGLFSLPVDDDGFGSVGEGDYTVKFAMKIPLISTGGKPRGVLNSRSGATIKYIVIASIKVVDPVSSKRSISHFYRECEVWPSLDPVMTLAPAPDPTLARAAKKLFMGGDGTLALTASLHRITWVAGQPCYVRCRIANETKKNVKSVSLALVRTMTLCKPAGGTLMDDIDDGETVTNEKRVAEVVFHAGQKGAKGHASAKGWWTGVGPGETRIVTQSIMIPPDALTIPRARLIEVDYAIRVALGVSSMTGNSEAVHVTLPICVVNFISLDPPPCDPISSVSTLLSSVIELDTPKPEEYSQSDSHVIGGMRMEQSPSEGFAPQYSTVEREDLAQDAHLAYPPSRNMPLPDLSDEHIMHDLGNVEDADDLNRTLGDIPGSSSLLDEEDITVDYKLSDYSMLSGMRNSCILDSSLTGVHVSYNRENFESADVDDEFAEEEDLGSDEEVERMVGCASARIDMGAFDFHNSQSLYRSSLLDTSMGGLGLSSENHHTGHMFVESPVREKPSGHVLQAGGVRGVRGPRNMRAPQGKEENIPSPEGRPAPRSLPRPKHHRRTSSSAPNTVRSILRVANPSEDVVDESPGSVYPAATTPSRPPRNRPSKLATQASQLRRPSASRSKTAPTQAEDKQISINNSPSRIILPSARKRSNGTGAHHINTPSRPSGKSGSNGFSPKTREEDDLAREHTYVDTSITEQILPVLPWWLLVAFGAYSLSSLGWGLYTFNDVPEAYEELIKEIAQAKNDLRSKGVDVD
ncbi:uncharacterized protein FOMMEDRAFT_149041 [Fomitiporia mediterranea MF3/22]|uniref:uncharacterized protein n=1 Tax=Fomitiporia mediterranea (strain MF3/22) TaxID=694068 RepID=UPI0004408B39|nr:uncharacterized protein FOMMEDRAFT_149041 [Fomitiporia mediterranea MF3/22]EJC98648.1 hypothetical protein FOMMEDRAFT_149041 [Fomitiporia mediterranea MF3/22]